MDEVPCKICGNTKNNVPYAVREMHFGTGETFDYFQCAECECLQIREFPQDMSPYYPPGYYSFSPPHVETRPASVRERVNRFAFFHLGPGGKSWAYPRLVPGGMKSIALRFLLKLDLCRNSRILDVGCGRGDLLLTLAQMGFDHLTGVDPFIGKDIHYPGGPKIFKASIREMDGEWDLIALHHSFEHVPDPLATLQHLSTLLSENGVCLVRIPVVSSFAWDHYKTHWVQIDAPRHFFLHSRKSLQRVAEKAGFRIREIEYDSFEIQFWGSEQYRNGIPLSSKLSWQFDSERSMFTPRKIREYRERSGRLNREGREDQASFYLIRNPG